MNQLPPSASCSLSDKVATLCPEDRIRYKEKIRIINYLDPYLMEFDPAVLPLTVDYDTILHHLINKYSFRTGEPNRNYKSLGSYNSFLAGFVKHVEGHKKENVFVVSGKVLHSMHVSSTADCWIIINDDESDEHVLGAVLSAHCDCTAGAGETCTHVAAVLYSLSYLREVCLGKQLAVTELPAYWMQPSGSTAAQYLYLPVDEINFGRKRETFCELRNYDLEKTEAEYKELISDLLECGQDVAARRLFFVKSELDEEADQQRDLDRLQNFCMTRHFDVNSKNKPLEELRRLGSLIDWSIEQESCYFIEEQTREQSASPIWFQLRYGRITASNFSRCVKTSIEKPSMSLINALFTANSLQSIPAILHGKQNEHKGVAAAIMDFKVQGHNNVIDRKCGLVINPLFPYFAASPDHIVECDCHGLIVIEVKCPFKIHKLSREEGINILLNSRPPIINQDSNENLEMCENHPYYYQIQMQIFLTNAVYGIFLVWAENFHLSIKVEQNETFWNENVLKAETFYKEVMIPEIVGKYYSSHA